MRQQRQPALEWAIRELEHRSGPGIVYRLSPAKPKVSAIAGGQVVRTIEDGTGLANVIVGPS